MRSNDADIDRVLRRLLVDHLVDDPGASVNFSVRISGEGRQGHRRDLHLLYHGDHVIARSRSVSRLVQALLEHLSAWDLAERTDLLRLHVAAFARNGGAILAPFDLGPRLEARLAASGFRSVVAPWVVVDPYTGELVVDRSRLALDADALRELEDRWPPSPQERLAAAVGRYDLRLWAMHDMAADRPSSPGLDLLKAAGLVIGADRPGAGGPGTAPALRALATLLKATPVVPADPLEGLLAATREVVGG